MTDEKENGSWGQHATGSEGKAKEVVNGSPSTLPIAPVQDSNAFAFLEQLRPGGPWTLTAIPADGTPIITTRTYTVMDDTLNFITSHNKIKLNVYFALNPL